MTPPSMFNSYSLEMESDREMERLMEAFVPCVREEQERRHPEWSSIVAKVKSATFLLKRYENRSEWTGIGIVEYADWCFYPEKNGSASRLAIHADLLPVRSPSDRASRDKMLQELQESLLPLQYAMTREEHILSILIPIAANQP